MADTHTIQHASDLITDWEALDPCPLCGARPHDAPEGMNVAGGPNWVFPHCFKCGYRPGGSNQPVPTDAMREQFEQFKRFMAEQTADDMNHPTMKPPADDGESDRLRAELAAAQEALARYETPVTGVDPASHPPFNPSGVSG